MNRPPVRIRASLRSFLAVTTALAMLAQPVIGTAQAQSAAPEDTGGALPGDTGSALPGDTGGVPPALVGRIAKLSGTVSYHEAGATSWSPAALNYPVSTGYAFWTEASARVDLQVAADTIALSGTTELDMAELDPATLLADEPQGEVYLHVPSLQSVPGVAAQQVTIRTPRGAVSLAPGRYAIVAGDANQPTLVDVVEGEAQLTVGGAALQVPAGQTATLSGTPGTDGSSGVTGSLGPLVRDPFLDSVLAQAQQQASQPVVLPRAVQSMTGTEELQRYGAWQPQQSYGQVWFPQVASSWVPYRDGHWRYVAPWGWTWVDDEPWGFAPFHYGRWSRFGDRWGWVPTDPGVSDAAYAPDDGDPVYAPALVDFVGLGAAAAVGAAAGFALGSSVGWVPLGPREPYYPPYRVDQSYFNQINRPQFGDRVPGGFRPGGGRDPGGLQQLANRGFASSLPASAMQEGRYGRGQAEAPRAVPAALFTAARPVQGVPVRPIATTPGMTEAAGRRLGIAAPPGGRFGGPQAGHAPAPAERPNRLPIALGVGAAGVGAAAIGAAALANHAHPTGLPALRPAGGGERQPGGAPGPAIRPAGAPVPGRPVPGTPLPGAPVPGAPVPGTRGEARPRAAAPGAPGRDAAGRPILGAERPGAAAARPGIAAPGAAAPGALPARDAAGRPLAAPAAPQVGVPTRPGAPQIATPTVTGPHGTEAARPQVGRPQVERPEAGRPEIGRPAAVASPPARAEAPRAPAAAAPRGQAPRVEAPRVEAPRVEAPRVEAPRVEAPRVQAPRVEAPREAPRPEAPRIEAPRPAPPRVEAPRAAPPPRAEPPRQAAPAARPAPARPAPERGRPGEPPH